MPGLINDDEPSTGISEEVRPEEEFQPGDLAPIWSGPIAPASISEGLENALIAQCTLCGNKDVAARRWEVEQDWEARLYNRGNQNILPRRGGGWVVPPYATLYNQSRSNKSGQKFFGHETNIVAAYGSIITAALGRDIPAVRFEPQNPMCDADVTAANAATRYARLFNHSNDLLTFQNQCIYYLYTGGRVIVCVDSILDGQRFGREEIFAPEPVVPETEENPPHPAFFLVRHGETAMNRQNRARGRSETPLDNLGTSQVEQAANYLKGKPIAAIISSPIERARESAQILAKSLNLPVAMDERLASFDLGSETGQQISSMREIFDNAKKNPNEPVGDTGESFSQFNGRLESFLSELLANPGGPAPLLVTHDSVIRQIASILNGPQGWLPGFTPPGGVAICDPLEDGTYRLHPTYPATPPPAPSHRTRPRSREITSCYGKLEAHVPINCQSLEEMPFVQLCREYDVSIVKAMFPAKADQIHPGGGGSGGENELDRIARINVNLALDATYITGDSMVRDCTVRRTFFRPAMFMNIMDLEIRKEALECFPEGCEVVMAGPTFIQARACSMDDHLSLIQAFPGSGMNRLSLSSTILSVQKRLNNWLDLLNDYFIRTIPNRYVDSRMLDIQALTNQSNIPGNYVPILDPDGQPINPATTVFVEPTPQPQPAMTQFIQLFLEQVPQLLCGATPTLFGALSNTDTPVGTASIQRDQALARLSLTWHAITEATCRYFLQAAQLAARCRTEDICGMVSGEAIRIELSELKGKCLARPESDANFPETWGQKQFRMTQLLQDVNNPVIGKILEHPQNLRLAQRSFGIEGFEIPETDAYEKQLGEFELLRNSGPQPNPQYQQLQMQAVQLQGQVQNNPTLQPVLQQLAQQLQKTPPEVSSVQVDIDFDIHPAELQACADLLNGPDGRRMKHGTANERAAFQNIRLHALEHKAQIKPPQSDQKPPHVSINYRDLPPEAASEALTQAGIGVPPQTVATERVNTTQLKRIGKTPLPEQP